MKRKSGYYWVRPDSGLWKVAYYGSIPDDWWLPGQVERFYDHDFIEINETLIPEL